jgi:hypothetical protein
MSVTYVDSQNDKIQIQYRGGLNIAPEKNLAEYLVKRGVAGLAESVPLVKINNKADVDYRQWPMIQSPYVNMDNNVLLINDGTTKIKVDWQSDLPVITQTN